MSGRGSRHHVTRYGCLLYVMARTRARSQSNSVCGWHCLGQMGRWARMGRNNPRRCEPCHRLTVSAMWIGPSSPALARARSNEHVRHRSQMAMWFSDAARPDERTRRREAVESKGTRPRRCACCAVRHFQRVKYLTLSEALSGPMRSHFAHRTRADWVVKELLDGASHGCIVSCGD